MRFDIKQRLVGGAAADPSPRTAPEAVPDAKLGQIPETQPGNDTAPQTLLLTLEGTTGNTAVVQLWLQDEERQDTFEQGDIPGLGKADRRFYQFGDPITVTVGQLATPTGTAGAATTVKFPCPYGRVYFQVTTSPAADAVLKAGWLGS